MPRFRRWFEFLLAVFLLSACLNTPPSGVHEQGPPGDKIVLTVVYTNDEHGWIMGEDGDFGAAEMAGLWVDEYIDDDAFMVLSGGDNWTGPAISTWFGGESTVEVMNAMGYQAAAVGNHEFDFGLDGLKARTEQAEFPYLAANIRNKSDGMVPIDLGIQPYTFLDAAGLNSGVIGLANVDTPATTNPGPVAVFDFTGYAETLREIVPEVRTAGADLIFVIGHLCTWELSPLAHDVADLGITLFGGGHCHEKAAMVNAGSVILSGGSYFGSYAYARFEIDPEKTEIMDAQYEVVRNKGNSPHPQVAEIASHWQELTDNELDVIIGYLENDIPNQSELMAALITETWLDAYPADVALTNWGGMRDRLPPGEITYASIISVMPFENVLVDVTLTGLQLERVLNYGFDDPPVGGIHRTMGGWILDETGEALDPDASYNLLVTDFLYAGGDDFTMLADFDPDAYNTAISWRQPVIDWILAQGSSGQNPLNGSIEGLMD
jgi:2',3'-cyclic-nucleotide 2'-phosphodiesterase (5'-nucleotidase family)